MARRSKSRSRSKSKSRSRSKSRGRSPKKLSKTGSTKFYDVGHRKSVMVPNKNITTMTRISNGKNGRRKIHMLKGKVGTGKNMHYVYKIVGNEKA